MFLWVFSESKWLNEYNLNKPKFYSWYVDDILASFDNEQDSLNFLCFLNNGYPNTKFTIEKQLLGNNRLGNEQKLQVVLVDVHMKISFPLKHIILFKFSFRI